MEAAELNSIDSTPRPQPAAAESILLGPGAAVSRPYFDMHSTDESQSGNIVTAAAHAFRRRWFPLAVLGVILGGSAGAAFWFLTKTQYTAVARVVVPAQDQVFAGTAEDGLVQGDYELKKRSQVQLMTSPRVLLPALTADEIVPLPLVREHQSGDVQSWLRSCLTVSFPGNAEIMELRVRCPDKETAGKLADSIREQYLAYHKEGLNKRIAQIERLKKDRDLYRGQFREAQAKLLNLEQVSNDAVMLTPEEQEQSRQAQLYWNERFTIDQQIWIKAERLKELTGAVPQTAPVVSDEELQLYLESSSDYVTLQKRIEALKAEIERAPSLYSGEVLKQTVARAQERITEAETGIGDLTERIRRGIEREKRRTQAFETPAQVESDIAKLNARKAALDDLIKQNTPQSDGLTVSQVDIEMKRMEVANLQSLLNRVQRQLDHAELAKLSDIEQQMETGIREDGDVYVHAEDDERRKLVQSCAAGGAVFVAVSAVILLFDLRRRKLNDTSDVNSVLQLQVLGTVPLLRGKGAKRMEQSARLAEAVDGVAATLLCRTAGSDHRLVMISSAMAGEGKTTLAANLATSLAAAGRRTLLVDFDLRRPMLHQVYQVPIGPGLGELLSAREPAEFGEYLQETMTDNLWLLTAGAKRHGALAELSDERVAELFHEFKEHFEFIIVDGPPVLPVVDTRLVARHADGVVISMLRDLSELPKVKAACQLLQSYRVNILGGVVIGASGDVYYGYPPERFSSIA